jgi:hypothetical protein
MIEIDNERGIMIIRHDKKPPVPTFLFHGTSIKHMGSICREGILKSTKERCNVNTVRREYVDDSIGKVSLSAKEKDAKMFANMACEGTGTWDLVVFKVDPSKLEDTKHLMDCSKSLFGGKKGSECQYYNDITPRAIVEATVFRRSNGFKGEKTTCGKYRWGVCLCASHMSTAKSGLTASRRFWRT